jgi:branched-chain amino acid transport system ATP-binding protein
MLLEVAGLKKSFGSIVVADDLDLVSTPPQARCWAGIGRTHQIPQPFEKLTVFENLLVGAVYGRRKTEREAAQSCGEILERLGLLKRANALAGSLTLLERKRLEMARALATAPKLLLLDEIAGGLTEGECAELVATIREIRQTGVAILWIEHVVHALLAVIDRLVVLNFGRKIAEGLPKEVMQLPEVHQIYIGIEA